MSLSPQTKLNEDFTVKAEGTGKGTMTVVTVYNAKVPEKDNKCDNFDLRVQVEDVKAGESPMSPRCPLYPSPCPLCVSPRSPSMSPHCPCIVPTQARKRMALSAPSRSPSAPGWGR